MEKLTKKWMYDALLKIKMSPYTEAGIPDCAYPLSVSSGKSMYKIVKYRRDINKMETGEYYFCQIIEPRGDLNYSFTGHSEEEAIEKASSWLFREVHAVKPSKEFLEEILNVIIDSVSTMEEEQLNYVESMVGYRYIAIHELLDKYKSWLRKNKYNYLAEKQGLSRWHKTDGKWAYQGEQDV